MANDDILKFCPRCAAPARLADSRKIVCGGCGLTLYLNTAAAVAALILDPEGRLMAVRRNRDPQRGLLDLPGGFVDFGESAEGALARELSEELGVEVEGGSLGYFRSIPNIYEYKGILYHTLDLFFTCRLPAGPATAIRPNDEIMEITYRFPNEIDEGEIAFDSMKALVRWMRERGG